MSAQRIAIAGLSVPAIADLPTESPGRYPMKKRREMLDAMREDARISTLEGKLQRVSSEAEAYRRFAERESSTVSGSKNQAEQSKAELEQLRLALEEERARNSALSAELSACKASAASERMSAEARAARLESELSSATAALRAAEARAEALSLEALRAAAAAAPAPAPAPAPAAAAAAPAPAPAPSEVQAQAKSAALSSSVAPRAYSPAIPDGNGSAAAACAGAANRASAAQRVQSLENDLRLSQLALKAAERQLERERRRAERAGAETDEARALLAGVRREQQVKDLQLDTMRADLQEMLCGGGAVGLAAAPPTPRASSSTVPALQLRRGGESKQLADAAQREQEEEDQDEDEDADEDEDDDAAQDIGEVLAEEMASMKSSYETKLSKLEDELQSARNELKELSLSARGAASLF